ncbi:WAT1-related protein [Acorus calamus]|uniref:WAT1-related protein n=1 Tax=Acorus calamus TaxID=4465 RepID=A0AAV9F039_ACOCL|nr:WAT1-related protein [Acorus calamus]
MVSLSNAAPFVAMVAVECLDVGLATLGKAAMSHGLSHFIFVFYSNALASLVLIPCSFIFHRRDLPPLNFSLVFRFFLLGLIGIAMMQNFVFTGVDYSSPTLGSAMANLVPACTFFIAVVFRLERFDIKSSSSQAKLIGTLVSISGALTVTLYEGPPIYDPSHHLPHHHHPKSGFLTQNWVLGGLFFGAADLSISIWNNLQAATVKRYPAELTIVAFSCLFGSLQCAIICLFRERSSSAWKIRPDVELIAILYSAVFGTMFTLGIETWCMRKKGPVFVASFKPLGIAIAAFMSAAFLGDTLHLGSVVGAVVIVIGFYGVIWGQAKEKHGKDCISYDTPLLHENSATEYSA